MLNIKQFPYGKDNLGYLVYGHKQAMAIDGGAVSDIRSFLENNHLTLEYITNTHSHPDHTPGNKPLHQQTGAHILGFNELPAEGTLQLEGTRIHVMHTPGHSHDSVCFYFDDTLISGDTLFNGKVGKCFTGDYTGFLQSIKKLLPLPPETRIFAGHDYVMEYLDFSRRLEPDNPYIDTYLEKYNPNNLFFTLAEEIQVNPYLRVNDEKIAAILKAKGLPAETEFDRWQSLLSMM